jgi:hypothetical protein
MDHFTREELELLLDDHQAPCISVYLPTERIGPDSEKDKIALKNLLNQTREHLKAEGHRRDAIGTLTAPIARLLDRPFFWPCGCDGLAIFSSPDLFRTFRLPIAFDRMALVSDHFHIKPLLPLLAAGGSYYILALSRGMVKLFHASGERVIEIPMQKSPENMEDTLRFDDKETQQQFHTGAQRGGRPTAVFHGQGVGRDESEEDTLRFLKDVDTGVHAILHRETAPLVLVAAEEIQGLYRRVNTYSGLVETGVVHNPRDLTAGDMSARALNLVGPLFERSLHEASEKYLTLSGHDDDQAVSDIRRIMPAASSGQVGTLFLAEGERAWGQFYPEDNVTVCRTEAGEKDVDLLDVAAAETLRHGGQVFTVGRDRMPGGGKVAAILRYRVKEKI